MQEIIVVASNAVQMQAAQEQLAGWVTRKIAALREEHGAALANYEAAIIGKFKAEPHRRAANRLEKQIQAYDKVRAAIEAGYTIVPNFDDIDIFAVRTTRRNPSGFRSSTHGHQTLAPQQTNRPLLGDGRYVDSAAVESYEKSASTTKDGKDITHFITTADSFDDEVDFPFRLVKPEILKRTSEAMHHKIFDDIGVVPDRRRRGDPMVIGRVHIDKHKHISFLITWFVDTREL